MVDYHGFTWQVAHSLSQAAPLRQQPGSGSLFFSLVPVAQ